MRRHLLTAGLALAAASGAAPLRAGDCQARISRPPPRYVFAAQCHAEKTAAWQACAAEHGALLKKIEQYGTAGNREGFLSARMQYRELQGVLNSRPGRLWLTPEQGFNFPEPVAPWDKSGPEAIISRAHEQINKRDSGTGPGDKVDGPEDKKNEFEENASEGGPARGGTVNPGVRGMSSTGGPVSDPGNALPSQVETALKNNDPAAAARALENAPENPETLSLLSAVQVSQGRYDEALRSAQAALAQDPDNRLAREMKAYIESTKRQIELKKPVTKPDFGAILQADGQAGGAGLGPSASASKDRGRPAPDGMRAPSQADAQLQKLLRSAYQKWSVGDLSGALQDAARAIETDRSSAYAWSTRAFLRNELKDFAAAKRDAIEALRLSPENAQAWREKGRSEYELGEYEAALADLTHAAELEPRNKRVFLYRAITLEKLGRYEEARKDYAQASRLDPELKDLAEAALSRLSQGAGGTAKKAAAPAWKRWAIPGLILIAVLFIIEGTKRMLRPGWRTSRAPDAEPAEPAAAGAATLAPGHILAGNFRVERELGRGGMGVVYEALDITLQRKVAVKQLGRAVLGEPGMRERFLKEARTAAKLRHPNLAEIHSVADEGGQLYLVFELVAGQTLDGLLMARGKLPLDETRRIMRGLCAALDYAHSRNIIHRDLKPANVMVSPDGACKVMDFGIAHEARGGGATRTAAWGTPPYMAPEQEMGQVSRGSDLYALGVMAYELLTGQRPFAGPVFLPMKLNKAYTPPGQANPALPRGADAFFAKALEPDVSKRFQSGAEFLSGLEALGRAAV